jgi:ATP-dependent Clp protease ATP-binding subunit ClpA
LCAKTYGDARRFPAQIIMTSNVGAEFLIQAINQDGELDPAAKDLVQEAARQSFRYPAGSFLPRTVAFIPFARSSACPGQ